MQVFKVVRQFDEGGTSGTGHVLSGVVFDDGTTVIRWHVEDKPNSTAIYPSYEAFYQIHIASHPKNESIEILCAVDWDNLLLYRL